MLLQEQSLTTANNTSLDFKNKHAKCYKIHSSSNNRPALESSPEHVNAAKTGFRLEMRKSTVFKPRARYQMIQGTPWSSNK